MQATSSALPLTSTAINRAAARAASARKTRDDDFVEHFFTASAHSYILLFTSKGRVYWLKVYEIPEAAAATRGKAIGNLVRFQENEKLTAVVPARNLEAGRPLRIPGDQERYGEEDRARGIFQSASVGHHRNQSGRQRRIDRREADRRQCR